MGKALIFDGLDVQNYIQTINFEIEDLDATRIVECFANITGTQQSAVKKLVKSLKAAGTFDKLSYLILPAIAGTVDEAIRNVMVDSDSIPSTTYMSLTDNLLFISKAVDVTNYIKPNTLNTTNISAGIFADFEVESVPSGVYSETIVKINTGHILYRDGNNGCCFHDGTNGSHSKTYTQGKGKYGISSDIDEMQSIMVYGNKNTSDTYSVASFSIDPTGTITATDTASVILSSSGTGTSYRTFTGGYKLLWVSSLLTETELVAMHKAFDEFITSVSGT